MFAIVLTVAVLSSATLSTFASMKLATGPQGPQGDKGDTGATGATGSHGPKGSKGLYVPDYDSGWID